MKKIFLALLMGVAISGIFGCEKDVTVETAEVYVQLDYIGSGGYYNDNIDGVPSGLQIGSLNGPYPAEPGRTYTIEYQASSSFPVITKSWTPTSGTWTIRCYVQGNTEYIQVSPR